MSAKVTYWLESDGRYLGYLNDFPEHWTQGESLEDLKAQLRDLWKLFQIQIPGIRRVVEMDLE